MYTHHIMHTRVLALLYRTSYLRRVFAIRTAFGSKRLAADYIIYRNVIYIYVHASYIIHYNNILLLYNIIILIAYCGRPYSTCPFIKSLSHPLPISFSLPVRLSTCPRLSPYISTPVRLFSPRVRA